MARPDSRFLMTLLAAGAASFLAAMAFTWLIERVPCQGEGLACKIDEAIGAYGVVIWAILGPLIFGLVLAIARNRSALFGAALLLLVPPVAFFLITQIEHTVYIGFEPERQLRTLLVTLVPPALTVLVQYLILRFVVPPRLEQPR
jgi:nitrate/nitrite transporter NarK